MTEDDKAIIAQLKSRDEQAISRSRKIHIVKSLAQYMKGYWKDVYLAWILVFFEVGCEVMIPFFSKYLVNEIDQAVNAGATLNVGALWMWGGIMIALAIVSCLFGIAAGFYAASASAGFGRNLRKGMYYRIQDYSFSNIDHFSTASLVTRMTTDVSNVQFAIQMILRMVVRAPMMMIIAFAMAVVTEWRLALIILAIIPFLAFVLFGISIIVHPTFVRVFNAYDALNSSVQENLNGIRVVKSYGREDFEKEKFGRVSYFIYRSFIKAERILACNNPAMQLSIYTALILIGYFGAQIIIKNGNPDVGFNTGSLTSLFTYVMQILNSLMMVSMTFVMITIARNSAERITEVLEEKPDITSPENALKDVADGSIEFNHVNFRYSKSAEKDVLHDIDLKIPSGATVGVIGATGSAKSSFISLIARLYDCYKGEVKVGGKNVKEYDIASLRDAVGVVLQKNVLFSGTIRSNLLWGNENATDEQLKHAAHLARADEFIDKLPGGYDYPIDEGGTNVSGGQKQRLCIARALLKNPKILILDDSTSAVDTHTDALIREAFANEIPDTTKIIVAQRILSIKDCDQIIVLENGEVVAMGTNAELMKSCDIYREIYETQLGGGDFDAA